MHQRTGTRSCVSALNARFTPGTRAAHGLAMVRKLAIVLATLLSAACGGQSSEQAPPAADELNTSEDRIAPGTYVLDGKPTSGLTIERLTILAGDKYQADLAVSGRDSRYSAGRIEWFAARANNPQSPVASDKPWFVLAADFGDDPSFEFDKLPSGGLKLYSRARQVSFEMKKDASWREPQTVTKTIVCTGPDANAELVLDEAQNRAGTLKLVGKRGVPSATVHMFLTPASDTGSPDWVRYEGAKGERDFSFGIEKVDFDRSRGGVRVSAKYAEDGQEKGIRFDSCQL